MSLPLVLDSDGLDALAGSPPPQALRALLAEAWRRDRDVLVPAVEAVPSVRIVTRPAR